MKILLLFNTKIQKKKYISIGLMQIFGLNCTKITLILQKIGFARTFNLSKLNDYQKNKLVSVVKKLNFPTSIELKKQNTRYITQLVNIRKYKNVKKHFKTTKKFK